MSDDDLRDLYAIRDVGRLSRENVPFALIWRVRSGTPPAANTWDKRARGARRAL
jgi:hypothetical protein